MEFSLPIDAVAGVHPDALSPEAPGGRAEPIHSWLDGGFHASRTARHQ